MSRNTWLQNVKQEPACLYRVHLHMMLSIPFNLRLYSTQIWRKALNKSISSKSPPFFDANLKNLHSMQICTKSCAPPPFQNSNQYGTKGQEGETREGSSAYVNQPTAWHASQSCKEIAAQALSQTALGGRLFVGSIAQWEVIVLLLYKYNNLQDNTVDETIILPSDGPMNF